MIALSLVVYVEEIRFRADSFARLNNLDRSNLARTLVNNYASASSLSHHIVPNPNSERSKGSAPPNSERNTILDETRYLDFTPPTTIAQRSKTWKQKYFSGWYAGALASCFTALVVLAVNSSMIIYAAASYSIDNGIGTLFSGDCARAKTINSWLQLTVNILSTVLLGASNYCMQCLNSPTREEVNKAHSKGRFLHIGVSSIHNIRGISAGRKLLWLGLGLSAFPLHLMCVTIFVSALFKLY